MNIRIILFLTLIAFFSCEKDENVNPDENSNNETSLTIISMSPEADAVIEASENYSFELDCYVSDEDFSENATYELQVYLSGEGNSSYVDCGSKTISVAASGTTTQTINGQFLITSGHNSPYEVEITLYRYENGSGTPFALTSALINYE